MLSITQITSQNSSVNGGCRTRNHCQSTPYRPVNSEPVLDEGPDDDPHNKREGDDEEGWFVDDDVCTDGGPVVGFLDAS